MKALPLWQPWASLVLLGEKRIETRGWKPPVSLIGQRIAIHACKRRVDRSLLRSEPFRTVLDDVDLPYGALLCTVVVTDWARAEDLGWIAERERAFGDYTPGRFGWFLDGLEPLGQPIPFRGSQGIFDVPDELLGFSAPEPAQGTLL